MTDRLQYIIDWAMGSVEKTFRDVAKARKIDHQLDGVCIGINRYDEPFIGTLCWGSMEERAEVIKQVKINLSIQEVTEYVTITENWIAKSLPGETEADHIEPMYREDREEGIILFAVSRDGEKETWIYPITRDADGVASLGPIKRGDYIFEPDLLNLFDGVPLPPSEIVEQFRRIKEQITREVDRAQDPFIVAPSGAITVPNTSRYMN